MTTTRKIEEMAETIRATQGATDFIGGGPSGVDEAAQAWIDAGFGASEAAAWWAVGAFDADRTENLRDAGLTPEQVAGDCPQLDGYSWAYAYCNCDVSLDDVLEAEAN